MKILITTDWYVPSVNGVVSSVVCLRKELIARGHDVRILTLSPTHSSVYTDGVTYVGSIGAGKIYPGARIQTAFFSRKVQRLIDWHPDIIHSQCEFSTFLIALRIAKTLKIPLVHTYHTVYEDYTHYFLPSKRWGRYVAASLSRWAIRRTSGVIVPTAKVRNLLQRYGVVRDIHVVPTGIDLTRFAQVPAEERLASIRKQLGIPDGNRILLYVGRLAKEKNLEELLRFHSRCTGKDLTFLIVGGGPYQSPLEELVAEMGLRDSVRFAGMIPSDQIADYYHLGDLFVSASMSETQGLTYIEALASSLPALCRMDSCLEGVIVDGFNGWQYTAEQEYLDRLDYFLTHDEQMDTMRKNAAQSARELFSSEAFAEKVEQIYRGVLGTTS